MLVFPQWLRNEATILAPICILVAGILGTVIWPTIDHWLRKAPGPYPKRPAPIVWILAGLAVIIGIPSQIIVSTPIPTPPSVIMTIPLSKDDASFVYDE